MLTEPIVEPSRTLFECRVCGKHAEGWSSGRVDEPGWRNLLNIDGPNKVCHGCVLEEQNGFEVLDNLRDEYPNVMVGKECSC